MAAYSDQQVMQDYISTMVFMNGIRYWMHDKMRIGISNNVRNLDCLDTQWAANAAVESFDMAGGEQFYSHTNVTCDRTWYYNPGKPVSLLTGRYSSPRWRGHYPPNTRCCLSPRSDS
jgi:hypothetical protein